MSTLPFPSKVFYPQSNIFSASMIFWKYLPTKLWGTLNRMFETEPIFKSLHVFSWFIFWIDFRVGTATVTQAESSSSSTSIQNVQTEAG